MKKSKFSFRIVLFLITMLMGFGGDAFGETTKKVNLFQRKAQEVIDPGPIGGHMDTGQTVTCILYKESGRCVFDPDIEAIQTYEIYNGTTRVGVYNNQYSFVQDAFNLSGVLILKLTTRNSTLSGKVYNY